MRIDMTYRKKTRFPTTPYSSGGLFGAYIVAFKSDTINWPERLKTFHRQLCWWRLMTDIPIHVIASGWTQADINGDPELALLAAHGGTTTIAQPQPLILNRIACLKAFYASEHAWGIMMDDDAILYHSPSHNSGGAFFSEIAQNDAADYAEVDIFFPINPAKRPGQNQIWAKNPTMFASSHVFDAGYDLKGSMSVVRNFRLDGRTEILPPASHFGHGEDTLFAIEAVSQGATVFRSGNIVLKELSATSHFSHSKAVIEIGNRAIAAMYAGKGLTMGPKHLLDRKTFLTNCLSGKSKQVAVNKP